MLFNFCLRRTASETFFILLFSHFYIMFIVREIYEFMYFFSLNVFYKHYICILVLILVDSRNLMFFSFMLISRPHREPGLLYTLV